MFNGNAKMWLGPTGSNSSSGGGFNPIASTTIDITGLTNIDMTGSTNYGIIQLTSSNATETVISITNCASLQKYTFVPAVGLDITWNDVLVSPTGNFKLPTGSIWTSGTLHGYMSFQRRTLVGPFYSKDYIDQYNN